MRKFPIILYFLLGICSFIACIHHASGQAAIKEKTATHGKIAYGVASFYSKNLQGSETSTGETFDHNKLTGASNFFKLNTWVRVTNLSNNKSIIVRINDRMHQRMADRGRVIDLTRKGAGILNFISRGLTRVMVEEVPAGTND